MAESAMWALFQRMRIVDLSVTVAAELPSSWPTHMPFTTRVWNYFTELNEIQGHVKSDAPYQTRFWIIDEHCGTHCDAPNHFIPPPSTDLPWAGELGTQSGTDIPLKELMGPAARIDLTFLTGQGEAGVSPWITAEHLRAWEEQHGALSQGEVALLHTGWDRYYVAGPEGAAYSRNALVTKTGPGWPAPNAEAVQYLFERGVRCLGVDTPSVGAAHDAASPHRAGLSRGMRYVEMLSGLEQLPPHGAYFLFLPTKIRGATGAPGRAIALLA